MSTKSSIKYREKTDDVPGFHLYDDVLDGGEPPPVYLRLDGVAIDLIADDGDTSVTVTLPRETAHALGLLDAHPASKPATEGALTDIDAIAKSCRCESDESGGMHFDRKAWGFFVHEIRNLLTTAQPDQAQNSEIPPAARLATRLAGAAGLLVGHGHRDSATAVMSACDLVHQHELSALTLEKLDKLLAGVANALKGEPSPLELHSWHDLPELAHHLVARNAHFRDFIEGIRMNPDEYIETRELAGDILKTDPAAHPDHQADLHPATAELVRTFARALRDKLLDSQRKYGWTDNWMRSAIGEELRAELVRHVGKGDPCDVAAYCAFLWYHAEPTVGPSLSPV